MIIAHISDPHFGTEMPVLLKALQGAVERIRPNLIVLSGDITQRARRSQFRAARAFFDALGVPLLAIPGNHDIPLFNVLARAALPYHGYKKSFAAREFRRVIKGIAFVGLDTTSPWRHTRGRLDTAHVDETLKAARNAVGADGLVMVAMHQPLTTAWVEDSREALINAASIDSIFCHYRVDLVMSGHVHVPMITTTDKLFAKTAYSYVFSGAGTSVSHRVRDGEPNSFNVIEVKREPGRLRVDEIAYDPEADAFYHRDHADFRKTRAGWTLE